MLPEAPSPHDPHLRDMRRMFLAVVTGSFLFLIPWIGYLSASLPDHREVDQWKLAWVGFDAVLIVALGVTALCAWRRLQMFIPWAVVTATLLGCDAWFDVVLDWHSDDQTGSVLTAVCAELPLAALLLYAAGRMIRLTLMIVWHHAGGTDPVPPLSRLTLVALAGGRERGRRSLREPGRAAPTTTEGEHPDDPPLRDGPDRDGPDRGGPDRGGPDRDRSGPDRPRSGPRAHEGPAGPDRRRS